MNRQQTETYKRVVTFHKRQALRYDLAGAPYLANRHRRWAEALRMMMSEKQVKPLDSDTDSVASYVTMTDGIEPDDTNPTT